MRRDLPGRHGWREIKTTIATIFSAKEGLPVKVDGVMDKRFNQ
jgi:hypothetical protein